MAYSGRWIVVAESVLLDARSNEIAAWKFADNFVLETFPYLFLTLTVATMFDREDGDSPTPEATLKVSLDGETIVEAGIAVDFQSKPSTRSLMTINAVVVPRPGALEFRVTVGGAEQVWKARFFQGGTPRIETVPASSSPRVEASVPSVE